MSGEGLKSNHIFSGWTKMAHSGKCWMNVGLVFEGRIDFSSVLERGNDSLALCLSRKFQSSMVHLDEMRGYDNSNF